VFARGGGSSAGRAPGCGPGGRGFESRPPPWLRTLPSPILQTVTAPQYESGEHSRVVRGVLQDLCRDLCSTLDSSGCVISRVVGDLLVDLVEFTPDGRRLQLGHGYLISDYPLTREVLERREARAVSLHDDEPEPNEARLLKELGFEALLMLPLSVGDELWALVEVYRSGDKSFGEDHVAAAEPLLASAGDAILRAGS
jgi:GAF domain-containing protein